MATARDPGGMTDVGESGDRAETESTLWYAALEHLIDEVVFINREDRSIVFVSPSVQNVLGYTPDEFRLLKTYQLIHPDDMPAATETAIALRAEPGSSYRSILRIRRADGTWLWCEIVGQNLIHEPSVRGVVQTLRDISERRALEDLLLHQARHDDLTGLPNRKHFIHLLGQALQDPANALAALFIDLDDFKVINDSYGHDTGDIVLQIVADRLRGCSRGTDVLGRLGGDEFVCFAFAIEDDESALGVGRRFFDAVSGRAEAGGVVLDIRTSVGVARSWVGADAHALITRADTALYDAKHSGGSNVALDRRPDA